MPRLKPNDERLSGPELHEFNKAVLDAFDEVAELTRVVKFGANEDLARVAGVNNTLDEIVFDLTVKSDTKGWSAELLQAFRTARPTNLKLLLFAQKLEFAPATPARKQLQRMIHEGDPLLDVDVWRMRMAQAEARVCRVERDDAVLGTAFLVGPSVALTNYHVLEEVYEKLVAAKKIRFRFDFKTRTDGVGSTTGTAYALADDWDIAHSAYSDLDTDVNAAAVPGMDELDYALVRLEGSPGGPGAIPGAPERGFVPLPDMQHDWAKRRDVMILQHPDGLPLKLAIKTDGVTAVLPSEQAPTRVRYSTRTEPGSSGSPCFDLGWNLIALHHSGDPKYDEKLKVPADWNEGIPIAAILESLGEAGRDELGEEEP